MRCLSHNNSNCPRAVTMEGCKLVCVSDYERNAGLVLARSTWEYYNSAAGACCGLQNNRDSFRRLRIRPNVLRDVSRQDLSTTVFGSRVSMPIGVAPSAFQKMAHPDGECANAKATGKAGTIFTLSTWSNSSIEEVAAAAPDCTKWFQTHLFKDRSVTQNLVSRAEKAGFKALVLTVDSPIVGRRNADLRSGFTLPPHLSLANFVNADVEINSSRGLAEMTHDSSRMYLQSQSWDDITWIKGITKLPLVLKGILTAEDASIAANIGVAAIQVSNHGSRQLDGTITPMEALPEIVRAVGNRCEVFMDGGVREGTDVFKALALGANMVFIGRPALWGLAAGGEEGVAGILGILKTELEHALVLTGCSSVKDIRSEMVVHESHYSRL